MKRVAKSELIATIERAWADAPKPPVGGIATSPDTYDERAEWEEALRDWQWRAVPLETLVALRMELPALTPEGLRYFLPAFLLAALEEGDAGEEIRFFLLSHFQVSVRNGALSKELSRFSAAEREALRAFFEYMVTTPDQLVAPDPEDWGALAAAVHAAG